MPAREQELEKKPGQPRRTIWEEEEEEEEEEEQRKQVPEKKLGEEVVVSELGH